MESLKKEIFRLAEGTSNGTSASEDTKAAFLDAVSKLEKLNPEPEIATSEGMTGNWKLLYTTNTGNSAGKLGPFVGDVFQNVVYSSGKYENIVRLGPGIVEACLGADWDVLGPCKWQVNFRYIRFSLFGNVVSEKEVSNCGVWRMTYLDDSMRVLWASGGKNAKVENVYVLVK